MKKGFTLTLQEIRSIHDSMNNLKMNLLLTFTFYYKYLNYRDYNLGEKTNVIVLTVLSKCKTKKKKTEQPV